MPIAAKWPFGRFNGEPIAGLMGERAIIESDTAPTDHNKLWRNTADGLLYYYDGSDWAVMGSGGGSGGSTWAALPGKPFTTIGDNLKVVGGALTVDTADAVEEDNTKPVTSAAVFVEVGNIEALLATI